jgi:hypothetical protein
MPTKDSAELREEIEELLNQNDCNCEVRVSLQDGSSYLTTVHAQMIEDIMTLAEDLISAQVAAARLDENAWSRQQMIAAQALQAPNSGFGRMLKWAIRIFNERKLELLAHLTTEQKEKS